MQGSRNFDRHWLGCDAGWAVTSRGMFFEMIANATISHSPTLILRGFVTVNSRELLPKSWALVDVVQNIST
jgi:hypothetical protein